MQADLIGRLTALADPARLRTLRLLEREELSVGELARALQLPQSTVSRHLKLLHEGDWIAKRTVGTASLYRLDAEALGGEAQDLWTVARAQLGNGPTLDEDDSRLSSVLAERLVDTRSFFEGAAGEWDDMRQDLFGHAFTAAALLGLVRSDWVVADLGCGTGNAAEHIAPFVREVIAVDREPAMLEAARRRLADQENVEFRAGDLTSLPIADASVDAALIFLVLHHVDEPAAAVAEAARILRPDGRLLIVDMVSHDRDEYRRHMGHRHLGFDEDAVRAWADAADLGRFRYRRLRPDVASRGPGLFVATMRRTS